ncbi:hexameric tyrosine-coordinated heme protein [Actinocorallia lasiicapitis]
MEEFVPGNSLFCATPQEGRELAIIMARKSIKAIQPDSEVLKAGRLKYADVPDSLMEAAQVVAIEFQTIAAANDYWREPSWKRGHAHA